MHIRTTQREDCLYSPEWLKLKRQTIPSVDQDMGQLDLSYTAGRSKNWYHFFVNSLMIFPKVQYTHILWSNNSISSSYATEIHIYVHQKTCIRKFIALSVVTQMFINSRMVHQYNWILYSNENAQLLLHATTWIPWISHWSKEDWNKTKQNTML